MDTSLYIEDNEESYRSCLKKIDDLISSQNYISANEVIEKSLDVFPSRMELHLIYAKNLFMLGAFEKAVLACEEIFDIPKSNKEIEGKAFELLGHIFLKIWEKTQEKKYLVNSSEKFKKSLLVSQSPITGVYLCLTNRMLGKDLNKSSLLSYINQILVLKKNKEYYTSLGIGYLLMEIKELAYENLSSLMQLAGHDYYFISDLREHVICLKNIGFDVEEKILDLLKTPNIIVFEGPSIKQFSDWGVDFTKELEDALKEEINSKIDNIDAKIGMCQATPGCHILFAEAMLEKGYDVHVVLYSNIEDYSKYNFESLDNGWFKRFQNIINKSTQVIIAATENFIENPVYYQFCHKIKVGSALTLAKSLSSNVFFLVLWDPDFPPNALEDSSAMIDEWIDPATLRLLDISSVINKVVPPEKIQISKNSDQEIETEVVDGDEAYCLQKEVVLKVMLYSDLVDFSKLDNNEILKFIENLASIKKIELEFCKNETNHSETHGDAIFELMVNPLTLAKYALSVLDFLKKSASFTSSVGKMQMRVALHAGFVFKVHNPITDRKNYYGESITRLARLEPVTIPGKIYATSEFVSLLITEIEKIHRESIYTGEDFVNPIQVDFVGRIELAKNYGSEYVYKLSWSKEHLDVVKAVSRQRLVFLGCGSAFTTGATYYHSNMIFQSNSNKNLLIDCGSDARHSLYEQGLGPEDIDGVFISHLHSDHVGGLEWLALRTYILGDKKPKLYISERLLDDLWNHVLFGGLQSLSREIGSFFEVHSIGDVGQFTWEQKTFKLVQTDHIKMDNVLCPSYGLFVEIKNKKIFITTDTLISPHFYPLYEEADIIFHDCETQKNRSGVHAHYDDLKNMDLSIKKKMWLYHYNDGKLPDAKNDHFLGFVKKGQAFEF